MALNIGLDIDNVLADFQGGWASRYADWFGTTPAKPKDLEAWDAYRTVTHFSNDAEFWDWINSIPRFWEDLKPITGALGGVYTLIREQGHRLQLITSRPAATRNATLEWVRAHFPSAAQLPEINFLTADQKGTVDVQVYVDDDPKTLASLVAKPCVIVFDQPWNSEFDSSPTNYHRLSGWGELVKFVHALEHPELQVEEPEEAPAK